jgi:hypothetical protein
MIRSSAARVLLICVALIAGVRAGDDCECMRKGVKGEGSIGFRLKNCFTTSCRM